MTGGSLFDQVLGPHFDELPAVFRAQYFPSEESRVVLEGQMRRVWRRGWWLWPLFWLASWFEILFPETGHDVPVRVDISSGMRGREPTHIWRRRFEFPNRRRHFTSRMVYDSGLGRIVETVGPGGLLGVAWKMEFDPPGTLRLSADRWVLRLGRWRVSLPSWVLGTGRAVQQADSTSEDAFSIDLTISHPLLGDVFGYEGTFRLRVEPTD